MEQKNGKWYILLFIMVLYIILSFSNFAVYAENAKNVYIIPIKGEINPAVTQFVKSSIKKAEADPSSVAILFEIDTLGGMIHEATQIRDAIMKTPLHTISFVNNRAESAGVLIAIASEDLVMNQGSTIGSAETIPYTEKNISYWKSELRATAEQRGRDPRLVEAMADRRIEIPDPNQQGEFIVKEGELLNLTTKEAEKLGFIDGVFRHFKDIFNFFDIQYTEIISIQQDFKIKIAQWATSSFILPVLLAAGFIGLIVELFTPGFGIGGTISLIAFSIFFGGSILAGNAGITVILIFMTGVLLLCIEAIVPGFGAPGIGGVLCIIVSIILASNSIALGIFSLLIAFILTIIAAVLLLKYAPRNKYFDKIILRTSLKKDQGYVPTASKDDLLGLEGTAITPLRPAGIIEVNDEKIDAITEGDFIDIHARIKIVKIEGRKIVVKKI